MLFDATFVQVHCTRSFEWNLCQVWLRCGYDSELAAIHVVVSILFRISLNLFNFACLDIISFFFVRVVYTSVIILILNFFLSTLTGEK